MNGMHTMSHCVYHVYLKNDSSSNNGHLCMLFIFWSHYTTQFNLIWTQSNLPGCRKTASSNVARISRHIFVFWQVVNLKTEHYLSKLFLFKKITENCSLQKKFKLQLFFKKITNYCVCQSWSREHWSWGSEHGEVKIEVK